MKSTAGPACAASRWQAAALFVAGLGLFMLCRRSEFLPYVLAMIVVAPIVILRFSRTQPLVRSVLPTTVGFPRYARQAGQAGADLMFTGSHEFPRGITVNDPHRAIENGFTHVRPTYDGITYAMDPFGRLLGRMDRGTGRRALLFADVPTQGVRTVYGRLGDWLAWLSIAALLLLSVRAIAGPQCRNAEFAPAARSPQQSGGGG